MPARKLPLSGVRVLVGRARHQSGILSAELRKLGATMLEIPFIEIRKPRSFKPLDTALGKLETYNWLILTSVNGVAAMWDRLKKLGIQFASTNWEGHGSSRAASGEKNTAALAAEVQRLKNLHIAAIGPATKKAIEQRHVKVDVVPKEYVAESIVRSLKKKVKGKRVLLVRAKVARDVIPRELRKAGAHVDVVEAYETVLPESSRSRLRKVLKNPRRRPHVITFTSSSTVRNFVGLVGKDGTMVKGIKLASIGPVTSATLRDYGLPVDITAREFTIPGLASAIAKTMTSVG